MERLWVLPYPEAYGTATLPTNTWTHLAATFDGTTLRLYVNGAQVSSVAKTGSIVTSTNPLQIGGDNIYGQYFAGLIDDVRVYNSALSQSEIATDMNTPVGGGGSVAPDTTPPTVASVRAALRRDERPPERERDRDIQ